MHPFAAPPSESHPHSSLLCAGRELPIGESFGDTRDRVMPFWRDEIQPRAEAGESILVVSSKNALRALLMGVATHVSPEELVDLDIPNGVPLVYDPLKKSVTLLKQPGGVTPVHAGGAWEALAKGPPPPEP